MRLYDMGRTLLSLMIDFEHLSDRTIRRSALTHACQAVLVRSRDAYAVDTANYRLLGLHKRAATTGSMADRERWQRHRTQIAVKRAGLPTAKTTLRRFRRACA
jgi:hypothetical protein